MKKQEIVGYCVAIVSLMLLVLCASKPAKAETASAAIERMIIQEARHQGFDPHLAIAIATVESGLKPHAVGKKGEVGLFQLRPEFHAVKRGHIKNNIRVAITYLSELQEKCSSYGPAFYICYNLGPNYPKVKHPTRFAYFKRVEKIRNQLTIAKN